MVGALAATGSVRAADPVYDPFVEKFAVGAWPTPDDLEIVDGWPAGLWEPARADSSWFVAGRAALRFPEGTLSGRLAGALTGSYDLNAWRADAARDLADPLREGLVSGICAPTLLAFAALAEGDSTRAGSIAQRLAHAKGADAAARITWSLRAASLGPAGPSTWAMADELLADAGPWDAGNIWAMAVGLRLLRGERLVPAAAGARHGRELGRLSRAWLTADDLAAAPYGPDLRGALGAISLPVDALGAHFAAHPSPPADVLLAGWWVRGQRRMARGQAEQYEELARRDDLATRWRMDLWRRASERRLLADAWSRGLADLETACDLSRDSTIGNDLRRRLGVWIEQALVLALSRERTGDATRILAMADAHPDLADSARLAFWRGRLGSGRPPAVITTGDRVDISRSHVRAGLALPSKPASPERLEQLRRSSSSKPWEVWRTWGVALATKPGISASRQRAARTYADALTAAEGPDALLAAAMSRLARQPEIIEDLLVWALGQDAWRLGGGGARPRPSPVPRLVGELGASEADRHALLGAALALGDMRGQVAVAILLDGSGLTRDEKRRFLYPLPASGPVLDALLVAENDPALLLAIARNESLFEPAVRSRAGALGFMQVMPFHHEDRGARPGAEHWSQPGTAVGRGDALVSEARRRYHGDPYRLLAAYNAGPGATDRWDRQLGGGADRAEFAAWIGYTETRAYVEKVLIDRDIYDWILSGAAD